MYATNSFEYIQMKLHEFALTLFNAHPPDFLSYPPGPLPFIPPHFISLILTYKCAHTHTLTGTSKSVDPHTKSWIYENDLRKSVNGNKNGNISFVEYEQLVIRMVKILEILNENSNGIVVGGEGYGYGNLTDISKLSWILREFELIDLLISQVNLVLFRTRITSFFIFLFLFCRMITHIYRFIYLSALLIYLSNNLLIFLYFHPIFHTFPC